MRISELQEKAHFHALRKGFYDDPPSFAGSIALCHSELSEALQKDRLGEDVSEELADAIIRIADVSAYHKIDLEAAVEAKMKKNASRPRLHGKLY